jgi:hypothetical protein
MAEPDTLAPDVVVVLADGTVVLCYSFLLRQGSSVLRHALDGAARQADLPPGRVTITLPLRVSAEAAQLALDRFAPEYLRRFPHHFSLHGGGSGGGGGAAPPLAGCGSGNYDSPGRSPPPPSASSRQSYVRARAQTSL